jgi:hypothetical protein
MSNENAAFMPKPAHANYKRELERMERERIFLAEHKAKGAAWAPLGGVPFGIPGPAPTQALAPKPSGEMASVEKADATDIEGNAHDDHA